MRLWEGFSVLPFFILKREIFIHEEFKTNFHIINLLFTRIKNLPKNWMHFLEIYSPERKPSLSSPARARSREPTRRPAEWRSGVRQNQGTGRRFVWRARGETTRRARHGPARTTTGARITMTERTQSGACEIVVPSCDANAALETRDTDDTDRARSSAPEMMFGAHPHPAPPALVESCPPTEPTSPVAAFPEPVKGEAKAPTLETAASSSRTKERIDTAPLEGIRALACAVIAANHWLLWYGEKKHGAIELQGGFAVTVFFFISGFVMYLAYGEKVCKEDFKYWVRRIPRRGGRRVFGSPSPAD